MPDTEALKLTMKLVEQAAEIKYPTPDGIGWEQGEWFRVDRVPMGYRALGIRTLDPGPMCLTAGCFAGHYAFSHGFIQPVDSARGTGLLNPDTGEILWASAPADQSDETIAGYARDGLGLEHDQADWLFSGGNTLADLQYIVDVLCDGDDA